MKNLPQNFIIRLEKIYPYNSGEMLENFSKNRLGSFRINFLNSDFEAVKREFDEKKINFQKFGNYENIFLFDCEFEYAIK